MQMPNVTTKWGIPKMKITKTQLTQIVQEELSNTMTEGFGLVGALSAVKDAEDKGIADAQDDFARIQAGGKVLQIDTTEETQEEEDAYNKGWQNEMDRLKQSAADRRLNRPPPPETPEDIEAAQAEYDFESHFSEGKMKITKSKLAQIVQEELNNAMSESEQWQMGRSRKASDMYQLGRDDYGAFSAEEPTDDGVELDGERYPDDENYVKGWRDQQEEDAQDAGDDSWDDEGGSDTDDSLNPDEPEGGLDDDWMWENKITKSQLAQIVQEELKATLSEAYSDTEYDDSADEQAYDDARAEALRSAIDESLEDWAGTPAPIHEIIPGAPEGVSEIAWNEAGEEYLFDLVKAGDVVRVEGSPNDDWYGKEANLYVLAQ